MSISCDMCLQHVKTRFKVDNETLYYISNLSEKQMNKMTKSELFKIYDWIHNGLKVCKDCNEICTTISNACKNHHHKNLRVYKQRIFTDRRDLKTLEKILM